MKSAGVGVEGWGLGALLAGDGGIMGLGQKGLGGRGREARGGKGVSMLWFCSLYTCTVYMHHLSLVPEKGRRCCLGKVIALSLTHALVCFHFPPTSLQALQEAVTKLHEDMHHRFEQAQVCAGC